MALEPITRQEQIIAGKGIEPITRMERFLKEYGGGSGGGVQSNWNQNDPTKPDYVKNRPFYTEIRELVVENAKDIELEGFIPFVVGDTITVKVDGVNYSLVAFEADGVACIGDSPEKYFSGTGELGWCIFENGLFFAAEERTVSYQGEVSHRLNAKYIPNYEYLCFNVREYFGEYEHVTVLSNGTTVYCTHPSVDFFGVSPFGIGMFDYVGFVTCFPADTYCTASITELTEDGVRVSSRLFVHSDNVEQGIADYKADYGIE